MSVELISVLVAVLAMGVTLAGLILTSNRGLRKDMREDIGQLRGDIRRSSFQAAPTALRQVWPTIQNVVEMALFLRRVSLHRGASAAGCDTGCATAGARGPRMSF